MNLVYKNEPRLFAIAVTVATLAWIILVLATLGIALIYLLFGFIAYLFVQSAFVAQVKGNGVRITESQYPDLHRRLVACCRKIEQDEIPEMYLLRTDFFNALAMKFLGRKFIVLFTDVVDALADEPDAIDFYIGHELGHIHRGHLKWMGYLLPAMVLPVLGTSYRRAQEYTCDRYGAFCCSEERHVQSALAAISAGDTRHSDLSLRNYLHQIDDTTGFWMSFHEFTGDYPWLCKRMASAMAFVRNEEYRHPRRSFLAGLLSIFVPRFGTGGGLSLLIGIAMIGVLAAIAVPAYQDYVARARVAIALNETQPLQLEILQYANANNAFPASLFDLGYDVEEISTSDQQNSISVYEGGLIGILIGFDQAGEPRYVVLEPFTTETGIEWFCYGQNAVQAQLPPGCRD